jgi:N-dimethylarginine dimethylaminohydrolase
MSTLQSDVRPIRRMVIKHARAAFGRQARIDDQWRELNYVGKPDFARALEEYENFVAKLDGIELLCLDADEGLTLDSIYPRDAAIATDKGMILCNMGKPARRAEPAGEESLFREHGVPILGRIEGEGQIEGGDVAWIDEQTLAVGRGYRTNDEGIRQLMALLGDSARVIEFHMPHYKGPSDVFHLMSVYSPIDEDLALVYSPLMPVPMRQGLLARGVRLVEVPDEEFASMGCNVLALAPRDCLAVEGNPVTRARLEAAGARVMTYHGAEISLKGCGGPTCMTRPLERS